MERSETRTSRNAPKARKAQPARPSAVAPADADTGNVRAIARAFEILRILALGGERGMRLTDIVAYAELSHPTVHRILQALIAQDAAEQDLQTRRYRVGPEISLLGLSRPAQLPVRTAAEPFLSALANELGDTAFLTIRSGCDSVAIDRKTGSYPIKVLSIDVGVRRPLGVGVAGVMLLASLPPAEADRMCALNAARLPPDGPSLKTIAARMVAARHDGYAYAEVGVMKGTRALSVPVFDAQGRTVAAMSVAAMADRLAEDQLPKLVAQMREKALLITRRLGELQAGGRSRG